MQVYADNAATTRMHQTAIDTMTYHLNNTFGNPSSLYTIGQIPKPNGNAVADTGKKHPAPLGALCAIHRKNLFSARFRYRKIYF